MDLGVRAQKSANQINIATSYKIIVINDDSNENSKIFEGLVILLRNLDGM